MAQKHERLVPGGDRSWVTSLHSLTLLEEALMRQLPKQQHSSMLLKLVCF